MARMPSIADTVDAIIREAGGTPVTKTAASIPQVVGVVLPPLKKLAATLRELPDAQLTYPVLHVVKTAMMDHTLGPLPAPASKPEAGCLEAEGLRKVANALRADAHADNERLLAKGAHALRASRGIMLLRELVRE